MDEAMLSAIRAAAEGRADKVRALLGDLVAATREGPGAVEALVAAAMEQAGCTVAALDYAPADVPLVEEFAAEGVAAGGTERCLVGRRAGAEGPSLLLFAHPDVEPYRPEPAWRTDPFEAVERDGRIHGWGVADDLAGLVMMTEGLSTLAAAGLAPAGDVILVSAPSKAHRRGIAAALHQGLSADAAVYCHPAESGRGLDEIKAFAPGQLEFTITVDGLLPDTTEPAHTAFAHTAVNPFDKALVLAGALKALDSVRGQRVTHPRLEAAIGRSTNLMISRATFGEAAPLSRLPPSGTLGCAMTLVPGETLEAAKSEVEEAVAAAARADPWLADHPPRIAWLAGVSAAETGENEPLWRVASGALSRLGARPAVNPLHTSSDIRNPIVQKGIPTVGFGPLCGGLAMSGLPDEWVDLADTRRAVAAVAAVVADWCGVS
jgi:acetylornithine deacetylase